MKRIFTLPLVALVFFAAAASPQAAETQPGPPVENPYDVLGKMFRPFFSIFFRGGKDPNKAMTLTLRMVDIKGRLPQAFEGAILHANVQFPDKLKLEAPVMGEQFTVCRNGDKVWATPGAKMQHLLNHFERKPPASPDAGTPLFLPITAQQAVFVVALFAMDNPDVAEVDVIDGREYRVLSGGLIPDLAKSAQAEDFGASTWIGSDYRPARFEIRRKDFSVAVDVVNLEFSPQLPASTWSPPQDATDVLRTDSRYLEQLLYVVMNSLQSEPGTEPWNVER